MANNLIVVPIYPPDFQWATGLLDSASATENIALGFTNQNEADAFNHPFPFKKLISNVGLMEEGFINKKKLDLLKQVYNDYKYIAIIDAECKFLQPVTTCLEEIWNSNCFLANHSTDGARIMRELITSCGYEYNDDLYPWFNCIPIYKSELLPGFWNWLDSKRSALPPSLGFDFLLFAVYCRYELNMPWRVLEGHAWHGLVENGGEWELTKNTHLIDQVVWSTYYRGVLKFPNIKMLFHLDRYPIK